MIQTSTFSSANSANILVVFSSIGLWCPLLDVFKDYPVPVIRDVVLNAYKFNQFVETMNVSDACRCGFRCVRSGQRTIISYIQCENFEIAEFSHQFIDSVNMSLGSSSDVSAPNYQYTPCWLVNALG